MGLSEMLRADGRTLRTRFTAGLRQRIWNYEVRGVVRAEWGETKRRLGTMGKNGKKQLMLMHATSLQDQRLLNSWNKVTNATVLRGGQRALRGFVAVRVKEASNTRDSAGDEGATPTPTLESTVATANLRRQIPLPVVREHCNLTTLQRRRQRRPLTNLEEHWAQERRARG